MSPFPPVASLLPHSGPAVLLDEIVSASEDGVSCRLCVRADMPTVVGGRAPAAVVIEYMAQAIGVFAGLRAIRDGEFPRIGYLLGTRELALDTDWLAVGDVIDVEVRRVFGDETLGSFECTASRAGTRIAKGDVKVYLSPKESPPT
jgi:predicted hotdog family 3-hydroxylacyl-ACP dehydratase